MNKEQVIQRIGQNNWKEFLKFMDGQTVGIKPDNTFDYYEYDVQKFESILRRKKGRF